MLQWTSVGLARELRTDLADPIAERDHDGRTAATRELRRGASGAAAADVDPSVAGPLHRVGVERLGSAPCGWRRRRCRRTRPTKQRLPAICERAAVPGAEKEHPLAMAVTGATSSVADGDGGTSRRRGGTTTPAHPAVAALAPDRSSSSGRGPIRRAATSSDDASLAPSRVGDTRPGSAACSRITSSARGPPGRCGPAR